MGKITSIYLTDEEAEELKRFCSENNCTQYSVLKTALKEILARPTIQTAEEIREKTEENEPETDVEKDIETEQESNNIQEEKREKLRTLRLRSLLQKLQELRASSER